MIIVYQPLLGIKKRYVKWLAEETGAEVVAYNSLTSKDLLNKSLVIIVSGEYFGNIPAIHYLKAFWRFLKGKKIIVLAIGKFAPNKKEDLRRMNSLGEEMNDIEYFKISTRSKNALNDLILKMSNLTPIIQRINELKKEISSLEE